MRLKDLNIKYFKGKPPAIREGASLLPYLTPDYIRKGSTPEYFPMQTGIVLVEDDDLILLWDGSNAGEFFKGKKGILASTMVKFEKVDAANDDYFYYSLKLQEQTLKSKTAGSGIPHVDKESLYNLEIYLPEKSHQSTIATILTTIDQAIEKTEQLIAKYERIKTGLMQDLLTRGIDEHGNIRSEETHEFKDSELGRVPKEWRVGTVGKDCRIHNSFRKPLSAEVRENMQGKYPYYGPTGILDYINEFSVDGKYVLIGEDGDHFLKFIIQEMTLLINGKFNVNNHAHILEGKDDCITEWIHCFFCHRDITYHLTRQGAGRFKLNKAALSNLQIAIPKKDEQIRIIEKVDGIRTFLQCESQALDNYRKLKIGLMQDLLTGKIRADYLLKKINLNT